MSAVAMGCMQFDPEVRIKGVVLNRIAGSRHEQMLRQSIEHHCGLPVLGAIPKLKTQRFPERHMGLVPTPEHSWALEAIDAAAQMAMNYLDLDALAVIAHESGKIEGLETVLAAGNGKSGTSDATSGVKPRIGIIRDSAFQFYYPENIEALEAHGAETVSISPLTEISLPSLDALYIGGGFPETHAAELAENKTFRNDIRKAAENGLPIYAECGGLMYLGEALVLQEKTFPMVGILPIAFGFSKKPQGHGYTIVAVEKENPYYAIGTKLKGHEFHYSRVLKWHGDDENMVFSMKRGTGIRNGKDGIRYKNVLATYTHIHALGTPAWAKNLVQNAIGYAVEPKGRADISS